MRGLVIVGAGAAGRAPRSSSSLKDRCGAARGQGLRGRIRRPGGPGGPLRDDERGALADAYRARGLRQSLTGAVLRFYVPILSRLHDIPTLIVCPVGGKRMKASRHVLRSRVHSSEGCTMTETYLRFLMLLPRRYQAAMSRTFIGAAGVVRAAEAIAIPRMVWYSLSVPQWLALRQSQPRRL